nr:unnamed protein product [Callosobruchus chinensis]
MKTRLLKMTHEFEDVLTFAFKEVVYGDPCLVRICIITLEELIHHNYTKLDAQNFFRFVYALGCDDLCIFMKEIMKKRFIFSSVNDISRFYVQSVVYSHIFTKLPHYSIASDFEEDLVRTKFKMDAPKEMTVFLFNVLPIKKNFTYDIMQGNATIEDHFFEVVRDLILPFKLIGNRSDSTSEKHYYGNVCKSIEKQIVNHDPNFKGECHNSVSSVLSTLFSSIASIYQIDVKKSQLSLKIVSSLRCNNRILQFSRKCCRHTKMHYVCTRLAVF